MGGAQPLAVTLNGGAVLIVDVDESRLARRVEHGYLDEYTTDLDDGGRAGRRGEERRASALSVGVVGNAALVFPELLLRGIADRHRDRPDERARPARRTCRSASTSTTGRPRPSATRRASPTAPAAAWPSRSPRWSDSRMPGPRSSTTATRSAREAQLGGFERAFEFPGFVPAYIRPQFAEGRGPFRWVALSGDPEDIRKTDRGRQGALPRQRRRCVRWLDKAGDTVHFEGLPARICWLGYKERHLAGLKFNEMVASGELAGPDRDRPRPPRRRLGRLAVPRDRGDGRRLRRDRRLAAAERAAQHRDRARRGCRSTTAAASASGAASTPVR